MFDGHWRSPIERGLAPIGESLRNAGITADVITVVGIAMAGGAAVAIGAGQLRLGLLLLILTGVPDALDGAVAKASGLSSKRGAFFDSVSDRVSDALLLGGIAWYLEDQYPGHIAILPMAVLAMSMLISYERAKAESLGFDARGGIMERAERLLALAIGLLFEGVLIAVLWVMLVLTAFTAVQRFVRVWSQASTPRARTDHPRWGSRRVSRGSERSRMRRERWAAARDARRRAR